ncbi:hypothetical protein [Gorillibacterium massiliense]|uniref:hypothetical protein n=1 Tax=Gorillibacterium massiliense TaxID=1280390 RepID=UPI00307BEF32
MTRLNDVTEGIVEIDGNDIRQLQQQSLYRLVGLVQHSRSDQSMKNGLYAKGM